MNCSTHSKKLLSFAFTFSFGLMSAIFFQEEPSLCDFHVLHPIKKDVNHAINIDSIGEKSSNNFELVEIPVAKQKNCTPADKNLKYHFLSETEGNLIRLDKSNEKSEKKINYKRKLSTKREEDLKRRIRELQEQISLSTKNILQAQNLLHKEHCFENNGRK